MNGLSLDSPRVIPTKRLGIEFFNGNLYRESSEDYDEYATPPSTPPPVYIMGLPTKVCFGCYSP